MSRLARHLWIVVALLAGYCWPPPPAAHSCRAGEHSQPLDLGADGTVDLYLDQSSWVSGQNSVVLWNVIPCSHTRLRCTGGFIDFVSRGDSVLAGASVWTSSSCLFGRTMIQNEGRHDEGPLAGDGEIIVPVLLVDNANATGWVAIDRTLSSTRGMYVVKDYGMGSIAGSDMSD